MEFLQHYLPGTPVENNSHTSFGFLNSYASKLDRIEFVSGMQAEIAGIKLKEFQELPLTSSSTFNNAVRPQGFHYDYEVDSKLIAVFFGFNEFSLGENLDIAKQIFFICFALKKGFNKSSKLSGEYSKSAS